MHRKPWGLLLPSPGCTAWPWLLSSVGREVVGVQVVVAGAVWQAVVSVQEALRLVDWLEPVGGLVGLRFKHTGTGQKKQTYKKRQTVSKFTCMKIELYSSTIRLDLRHLSLSSNRIYI